MTSDHWVRRIQRVESYIREHLTHELDINALATIAHSSPYHFHRMFRAVTGETVAGYVRRARLERAAYLMKARPKKALTSIALEVGFPSLSDFSRSFNRAHGIAPSRWDRKTRLAWAPDEFEAPANNSRVFPVSVLSHPPCRLAYVRVRTCFQLDRLREGYDTLTHGLESMGVNWTNGRLIGMSWDHYETTPLDQVSYDFGFVVSGDFESHGRIDTYELPAFSGVHVHCCGELQQVADAWDFLYDRWLPESKFEPDDLPAMKFFNKRPDETNWRQWDVDCVISLRESMP